MADFALWVAAGAPALGIDPAAFLTAYHQNRTNTNNTLLENSFVAQALRALLDTRSPWQGTTNTLLHDLGELVSPEVRRLDAWPQTPQAMRTALQRLTHSLAVAGITVARGQRGHGGIRLLTINRQTPSAAPRQGGLW